MDFVGYLIFIYAACLIEVKIDEQIKALKVDWKYRRALMHSPWQLAGRGVLILAIIWASWREPLYMEWFGLMLALYIVNYWAFFDTIFAVSVMKKAPWYLGGSSKIDKMFGSKPWVHIVVWSLKVIASVYLIYLTITLY